MAGNILDTDALAAQMSAQDAQYAKQASAAAAQRQAQEQQAKQPPTLTSLGTADRGHVTASAIDGIVSEIGQWGTAAKRLGQDAAAGVATGAANMMDAAKSAGSPADPNDPANLPSPIWDHAHKAIMDFRDAVAVKDPNVVDSLTQSGAQLVAPFAAFSKALSGIHGISNIVAAGALTDTTALQPHDMRTADLIALGRQTDTKLGHALQALGPYGLNAYVNYLADRSNESEAEGRFKNALDGFGANLIMTPLLHAAGIVVKQGMAGARFMVENGVGSAGELAPNLAAQRGAVGDLSAKRPPLRQGVDPAESLLEEQARRDADAAAANPKGKRPPLRPGSDPAQALYEEQIRRDAERVARHLANNASGESSASTEAINRVAAEHDAGASRWRIDPDGQRTPLIGVDAVDVRAPKGHVHTIRDAEGNEVITDRGGLSQAEAKGLIARSKLYGLPEGVTRDSGPTVRGK